MNIFLWVAFYGIFILRHKEVHPFCGVLLKLLSPNFKQWRLREVESSASQSITELYIPVSHSPGCVTIMWSATSFQHVAGVGAYAFCTFTHYCQTISSPNSSRHTTFYLRSVKNSGPAVAGRALRRTRVAAQSTTTLNPSPTFTQEAFEDFLVNLQRSICDQVHLIPYQLLLVVLVTTDLFQLFWV